MQKVVKIYHALDQFLLSKVQDGYLWLLDRTGVYVATLMFVSFGLGAGTIIINNKHGSAWTIALGACLAIVGFISLFPYYLQDKGKNEIYNALAMSIDGSHTRHFFLWLHFMCLLVDFIGLNALSAINSIFRT